MDIKANYQEIEINSVDIDDRTFLLTPGGQIKKITDTPVSSVQRKVLLTPPLLRSDGKKFIIVTGHEIFRYFKDHSEIPALSCLIVAEPGNSLELLALALEYISISHEPSPAEQAICLDKAMKIAGKEKAISFLGPLISLSHRYPPERLLQLIDLDYEKLHALHGNRLEISTAFSLITMKKADRDELFHFIIELKLSSSNQRKLVKNCLELARRNNCNVWEILQDGQLLEIMEDRSIDPPKKTSRIMNRLKQQINPRLSGAEEDFEKFISELSLPKNSVITHAPSFEKDSITITTTFSDKNEIASKLPKLKEIIEND